MTLSSHAGAEARVIVEPASHLSDEAHDVLSPHWEMFMQPFLK